MFDDGFHDCSLIIHVFDHDQSLIFWWSNQSRTKHDRQVVSIHLETMKEEKN